MHRESGPLADPGAYREPRIVPAQYVLDDRKAEPGALLGAAFLDIDTVKALGDAGNVLVGNARPEIAHGDINAGFRIRARALDDDFDKDRVPNGIEFLLGGNPALPNDVVLPAAILDAGELVLSFDRADEAIGALDVIVQLCNDLVSWETGEQIAIGKHRGHAVVGHHHTAVQDDGPLAQLGGIGQIVGDDDHRGGQGSEGLGQFAARHRIEIGRRLVKYQDLRFTGQNRGQRRPPTLTTGEMRGAAVGVFGHRHDFQRGVNPLGQRVTSDAEVRRAECDVLCDGLERLGWEVERPKAGMFVWAKIPEPWAQMGSIDFAMKLLDEGGVAVSPGRGFGEDGEGYLRLAIVENSQRLRQAVREIGRCTKVEEAAAS